MRHTEQNDVRIAPHRRILVKKIPKLLLLHNTEGLNLDISPPSSASSSPNFCDPIIMPISWSFALERLFVCGILLT